MDWCDPERTWRSGRWSLALREDDVADIAFDDRPVLRSIRAVVRDRDWDTADLVVDEVTAGADTLTLRVHSEGLGSSFAGVVSVAAEGASLTVAAHLRAGAEFWTNRTGLVVLHPPHLAGDALQIRHSDGTMEDSRFPRAISPHQPAVDIVGLAWEHDGLAVDVAFSGDVFEMEDQRNWTDASYKTYSRPLALPFPYRIGAGEHVAQQVRVTVDPVRPPSARHGSDVIDLAPGGPFPRIGVSAATGPDPAPALIASVGDELLVELDLAAPTWRAALARAAGGDLPLDVRIVRDPSGDDALREVADALRDVPLARVAAFSSSGASAHVSDADTVAALRAALRNAGVAAPVVGGSRSHFTELNRELDRLPRDLDGLVTTVTPLFHALGTAQLVESVAMQRVVAAQTVGYAHGAPVHIGPVALRPRYNNVATGAQPAPTRSDLAEGYGAHVTGDDDARLSAPELAAWTVAAVAALAVPGVATLSLFEEWGPRGIRDTTGSPYPVAAAVEALARLRGELLTGASPDGLVWAIGARDAASTTVLVANLDRAPRTVTVRTPEGSVTASAEPFTWVRGTPRG